MKRVALLLIALASASMANPQFYGNPLRVEGSSSVKGNYTSYVLKLKNMGDRPIEKLKIFAAGMPIHYITYNPRFIVNRIPAKGSYELRFTLRGALAPAPDPCDYGIDAEYRYGNDGMTIKFPGPRKKQGY